MLDLSSNVYRNLSSAQISVTDETTTYSGAGSTPDLPSQFHEVSDVFSDDDGYADADSGCTSNCTPIVAITRAQHQNFLDCGKTQSSIEARIADCASKNGALATWSAQQNSTGGQSNWSLVTRMGVNSATNTSNEVWRDQRTGLVWSSMLNQSAAGDNWCLASGNGQANDASICGSAAYQPQISNHLIESECAETNGGASVVSVPGWCSNGQTYASEAGCTGAGGTWTANSENYQSGIYSASKGGMGAQSPTTKVRWRLPTMSDWEQAEIDGVRFVMPDLGTLLPAFSPVNFNVGASGQVAHWTSTVSSRLRDHAWLFGGDGYYAFYDLRTVNYYTRCVGR